MNKFFIIPTDIWFNVKWTSFYEVHDDNGYAGVTFQFKHEAINYCKAKNEEIEQQFINARLRERYIKNRKW